MEAKSTKKPRKPRHCSICREAGHDRRTCPVAKPEPEPEPEPDDKPFYSKSLMISKILDKDFSIRASLIHNNIHNIYTPENDDIIRHSLRSFYYELNHPTNKLVDITIDIKHIFDPSWLQTPHIKIEERLKYIMQGRDSISRHLKPLTTSSSYTSIWSDYNEETPFKCIRCILLHKVTTKPNTFKIFYYTMNELSPKIAFEITKKPEYKNIKGSYVLWNRIAFNPKVFLYREIACSDEFTTPSPTIANSVQLINHRLNINTPAKMYFNSNDHLVATSDHVMTDRTTSPVTESNGKAPASSNAPAQTDSKPLFLHPNGSSDTPRCLANWFDIISKKKPTLKQNKKNTLNFSFDIQGETGDMYVDKNLDVGFLHLTISDKYANQMSDNSEKFLPQNFSIFVMAYNSYQNKYLKYVLDPSVPLHRYEHLITGFTIKAPNSQTPDENYKPQIYLIPSTKIQKQRFLKWMLPGVTEKEIKKDKLHGIVSHAAQSFKPFIGFKHDASENSKQTLAKTEQNTKVEKPRFPTCSICTCYAKKQLCELECGHVFHTKCIMEWVKIKGNNATCPNCRKNI